MKNFMLFFILALLSPQVLSETKNLERLNFYPDAQAYLRSWYTYELFSISTPQDKLMEKTIRNFKNMIQTEYAWKFPSFFLGIKGSYEYATESAANYGIASKKRYVSQGFNEPAVFLKTRLRKQKDLKGNIDLYLSYSDNLGTREIGKSSANRLNGRNIFNLQLSHGFLEEEWEFQNLLAYTFFDEGEEHDHFNDRRFNLGSYNILNYLFSIQYNSNEWMYLYAGVGIEYRTVQSIRSSQEKREIQAGTGSVIKAGIKKPLGTQNYVGFEYDLRRFSYFVKGSENFDGTATQHQLTLQFVHGF